jgi:beta-glucosidase
MSEGRDATTLELPDKQDDLVNAVAAANPHTIVVLETGGPVSMPWADKVSAILSAWFPGIGGGPAMSNILFGDVNPSAKLPVTFARSEKDLPHPEIPGLNLTPAPGAGRGAGTPPGGAPGAAAPAGRGGGGGGRGGIPPFDVPYAEKLKVGYKWFDAENKEPLFPFGHGLSYTSYTYSDLRVAPFYTTINVTFSVKNTGKRAGKEIVQVYAGLPASTGEPPKRLAAWLKVDLAAGETKSISFTIDPLNISIFDEAKDQFVVAPGEYKISVGASSRNLPLTQAVKLEGARKL